MTRQQRSLVIGSVISVAVTALAATTAYLRTRDVPVDIAVSYGAQALTGPLFAAVGAVILTRRPGHRMGWFCLALGFASTGDEFLRALLTAEPLPSTQSWVAPAVLVSDVLGNLAFTGFAIFLPLLFPDGDVPSPRWRWVLWSGAGLIGTSVVTSLLTAGPLHVWVGDEEVVAVARNPLGMSPFGVGLEPITDAISALAMAYFIAGLAALITRFRRDLVARRQIKWILLGFLAAVGSVLLTAVPGLQDVGNVLSSLAFAVVPVTIGVAITRYRLFEVDRLLSRTVSYLVVVLVLVGLYAGSVLGLSSVARAVTGESGDVVVALSTLAVAAAFQPVRRRVQSTVDRRFNRRRYDANRTLDAFGRSLRDELDGEAIAAALGRAAGRSLQPQGLSVLLTTRSG